MRYNKSTKYIDYNIFMFLSLEIAFPSLITTNGYQISLPNIVTRTRYQNSLPNIVTRYRYQISLPEFVTRYRYRNRLRGRRCVGCYACRHGGCLGCGWRIPALGRAKMHFNLLINYNILILLCQPLN